jgi:transposase InsO family protein
VVVTATFQFLYVLIVLNLERRRIVHFEVTRNPTQVWLSSQMTEAFPWDTAPCYLLRDRDKSYGPAFRHRVRAMGITEIITPRRSPWQNPYVERLIGSIRRECLDHVIVLSERHLRSVLSSYFQYHHDGRTHFSLNKNAQGLVAYSFPPRATSLPSWNRRFTSSLRTSSRVRLAAAPASEQYIYFEQVQDFGPPWHPSSNRGLADLDTKLQQFPVDAGRAPHNGLALLMTADQITDF